MLRGFGVGYVGSWVLLITGILGEIGMRSDTDSVLFIVVQFGFALLFVICIGLNLSLAIFARPSWAMPRWLQDASP
jgi:uncharacterized transporter YbjL